MSGSRLGLKDGCCGAGFNFEPFAREANGRPLMRLWSSIEVADTRLGKKGITINHLCVGKCDPPSACPHCSNSQELGAATCRKCGQIWQAIRTRNGKIHVIMTTFSKDNKPGEMPMGVGPMYAPVIRPPKHFYVYKRDGTKEGPFDFATGEPVDPEKVESEPAP